MTANRLRAAVVAAALVAGCTSESSLCDCAPVTFDAFVVGFVTDQSGQPVDATVRAGVRDHLCQAAAQGITLTPPAPAIPNVTGRYQIEVSASQPDSVCIRVVARNTRGDSVARDSLMTSLAASDSVRVDFVLP